MRFKISFAFAFALLLSVSALTAFGQTVQVGGKVTLRQADGTEVPVPDALVTFYRTDISGKYEVKTNKKGEYVRLGMPFGTFMIVVSAPNARPTFFPDVNVARKPDNNFVLSPGDGRVLTLAEAKAAAAATTPAATAGGAPAAAAAPANNAEARRLAEEEAKKIAEIEARNARSLELNTKLPEILKTGNAAFTSKNYAEAITAYDQGIAADPTQGVFHLNKALALRERGVATFNTAVKSKDQAGRSSAKADIKGSVEALEKAVAAYRGASKTPQTGAAAGAAAGGGASKSNEMLNATRERAESYRIAMLVGLSELAEPASVAMQEYIDAETDQAQKTKFEIALANALRDSGQVDKAVAIYRRRLATNANDMDATFGLAMALQFDEPKLMQNAPEVISLMKQVLAKDTTAAADRKQAATDSIDSMEGLLQQKNKPATESKPRNTRRRG